MNKMVSVRSEPQPQKSPETPPPSVPITSLEEAKAFVNAQDSLSTEDLFKTLLMCHDRKPKKGWFESVFESVFENISDKAFLTEAIKKGASSQESVSAETQKRIALAICTGEFGNPIPDDVAFALVSKLDTFTEEAAQEDISEAICSGRFGNPIPDDVALAIVSKLDTFTEEAAQGKIAKAISQGKFGNDPEVLKAAVGKLAMFKAQDAHRYIAEVISKGTFGNDTAFLIARGINVGHLGTTAVLKAVAGKLDRFSDEKSQQNIAHAIKRGKFGNDTEVLKAVAGQLAIFKDPSVQFQIAKAIKRGKFGNDTKVLEVVAGQLAIFTDKNARLQIAKAIRNGTFGTDSEVLKAVAGNLPRFTDPTARLQIAKAISNGTFGTDSEVLKAVAGKLAIFTDSEAEGQIAMAGRHIDWVIRLGGCSDPAELKKLAEELPVSIGENAPLLIAIVIKVGKLETDPSFLKAVAGKLATFKEPAAQLFIAEAIINGEFGTDPEVLKAVAGQLRMFTHKDAQRDISKAIINGKFGTDTKVLEVVAGQLDMFTAPEAQRDIAWAIRMGRFETNTDVLKAVAGKLSMFTDTEAKLHIAWAISRGKFGNDTKVLEVVAGQLAIFKDHPGAQQKIARAIRNGTFGTNTAVLKAVAEKLDIFTDRVSQRHIFCFICGGNFGEDTAVLNVVAGQLAMFTDRVSRRAIAWAISRGNFGKDPEVLKAGADEKTTRAELNRRLAAPQFVELLTGVGDEGVPWGYVLPLISAHLKSLAPEESQMKKLASQLDFAAEIEGEEAAISIEKIKHRLATADNEVVIPYGMHKHAMLLKLKFTDKGLNVEIYNSGLGLGHHVKQPQEDGQKYNTCKEKFYPDMRPASPEFNTLLTDIVQYREFKHIRTSYKIFKEALDVVGGTPNWQRNQKGQNCTLECVMAFLKKNMSPADYLQYRMTLISDVKKQTKVYRACYKEDGPDPKAFKRLDEMLEHRKVKAEKTPGHRDFVDGQIIGG